MQTLRALGKPACKRDLAQLSYTARNTGHLAYLWKLVHTENPTGRGGWKLTAWGELFLKGVLGVPLHCVAAALHVHHYEGPAVRLHDVAAPPAEYPDYRAQATR